MGVSGAKGGLWERNLLDHLRNKGGFDAERLRLAGKEDEGDLVIKDVGMIEIIEAKDVARWDLNKWWDEAIVEAANYEKHRGLTPGTVDPLVVVKRRGSSTGRGWVIQSVDHRWGI